MRQESTIRDGGPGCAGKAKSKIKSASGGPSGTLGEARGAGDKALPLTPGKE